MASRLPAISRRTLVSYGVPAYSLKADKKSDWRRIQRSFLDVCTRANIGIKRLPVPRTNPSVITVIAPCDHPHARDHAGIRPCATMDEESCWLISGPDTRHMLGKRKSASSFTLPPVVHKRSKGQLFVKITASTRGRYLHPQGTRTHLRLMDPTTDSILQPVR